ncbi:MAG: NAD kinase [Crocinitomicaceae bacterium]|nr:NAD kinase [Crocinitomicaceae bacterium]MBK9590478.1 NAD kinase [Crocinitomicaceae bacterium]
MRVGIYGRHLNDSFVPNIQELFTVMKNLNWNVMVYEPFFKDVENRIKMDEKPVLFNRHEEIWGKIDLLISVGGDGTFLETIHIVRDSGIPVLGVNTGRLGFLASTHKDEIKEVLEYIHNDKYRLQNRTVLTLETKENLFGENNFALNELTVHKKDSSSMITIHAYFGDLYLNSYWADGLIISTPTGSTAYSLSCGGPIVVPGSGSFVITPIAPHNLNVRPIVVPDNRTIRLKIEGRGEEEFLCTLDSKSVTIDSSIELYIKKANFELNVVQTDKQNFLNTIRNKMMWGLDSRN